jgi:hypothetical protein
MTTLEDHHVTSMSKMEERLLAKIDAFNGKFGDLRTDVNDHERRLVAFKSNVTDHETHLSTLTLSLLKQESVLKGYNDTSDKSFATLRTDVNDTRAKIPGLVTSIKEVEALVHDLRQQQHVLSGELGYN